MIKVNEAQAQRSELLDVLSDVKTRVQDKLGDVSFPLPQFILIGKQSVPVVEIYVSFYQVGKSRLIESLAGEQFNFVSGNSRMIVMFLYLIRNIGK